MKKFLIVLTIFVFIGTVYAADGSKEQLITLPSAEELAKRIAFPHLLEKTELHKRLSGHTLYPSDIVAELEMAFEGYRAYLIKGGVPGDRANLLRRLPAFKSSIMKTILQDHPEAIAELTAIGYIQ